MDQKVATIDGDLISDNVISSSTKPKPNTSTTSTSDTKTTATTTSDKSEKVSKTVRKTNKSIKRRSTADIPTQKKPDKKKQKKSNSVQQTHARDSKAADNLTPTPTLTGTSFTSISTSHSNDNIQSGSLNIAQELAMNRNNTLNSLSPEVANIISSQSQITNDLLQNDNQFSHIPNSTFTANIIHNNNNNNSSTLTQTDNSKPMKITSLISKTVYPRQKRLLNPGNGKLEMMNSHMNADNDKNNKSTVVVTPENIVSKSSGSDLVTSVLIITIHNQITRLFLVRRIYYQIMKQILLHQQ